MPPFAALVLLLFLFVSSIIAIAAYFLGEAPHSMDKRLQLISKAQAAAKDSEMLGSLVKAKTNWLDERIRSLFSFGSKRSWAMKSSALTIILLAVVGGGGIFILSCRGLGVTVLLSILAALAVAYLVPNFILRWEQNSTERKFIDHFPDALDSFTRTIKAGLPITAAVMRVAADGLPPVNIVFGKIAEKLEIGLPVEEILDGSSKTIGLPDYRFFTIAISLQYSTGGNLTTTLETLSDILRKRRATRLKANAATGEIRITAAVLGSIPFVTAGALLIVQPDYLIPLWQDPRGHIILGIASGMLLFAFIVMRAMMRSATKV